jgi:sulfur-oxidizing protein SoxA
MKRRLLLAAGLMAAIVVPQAGWASPEDDLNAFREFFYKKFPKVPHDDFINGVYAIDANARMQWEGVEEFPPYEPAVEHGEELFNEPFANGKAYADCFPEGGIGIRQSYPFFDTKTGQVRTLEGDINDCRVKNGEKPLKWKKGDIADLSAYMAYTSRGNKLDIKIPDDPRALAAYERGKRHFYSKRGQLNFACADCHVYYSGGQLRADILSPALGHPTHFPVYRSKWGELGTLHRRYEGCNKQVRAKPFKAQSEEYRDLEYFHTYMSNGLEVNGPGARK